MIFVTVGSTARIKKLDIGSEIGKLGVFQIFAASVVFLPCDMGPPLCCDAFPTQGRLPSITTEVRL
jgi:hypothetical protein